jgi:signal transduction histidine kinase
MRRPPVVPLDIKGTACPPLDRRHLRDVTPSIAFSALFRHATRLALLLVIAGLIVGFSGGKSRTETVPRSVLILDESGPGGLNPGYAEIAKAFRSTLRADSAASVYAVNLDFNEFSGPEYQATLPNYLKDKYRDVPIGAFLALGSSALEFAVRLRSAHWPNVPIVFTAVDEESAAKLVGPVASRDVTGRILRFSLTKSVDIARALVPDLKKVALVGDPLDKQLFRRNFKDELPKALEGLELIDLTGLSLAEVKARVAALPDDTAILYTAMTNDGAGTNYLPYEMIHLIAEVANRPIVVDVDNRIGLGGTGGAVVRPAMLGEEAAEIVLRIFNGEAASQIPIAASDAITPMFDWRQLKRWGISKAQLPSGSEVHSGELSAWEEYQTQIILVLIVLLLQSALIAGLLYEDRRRRTAEARSLELSSELAHVNRMATAGELTAAITHEIRQPLAGIVARGNAGLNWLKKATPDLDKVRSALENIVDSGHRADQVLRNTRAMFRKEDTSQGTLNVNAVTKDVLSLVSSKMAQADIKLVTNYMDAPVPIVRINRVQLQQVLLNLTMNAIEAMSTMKTGERVLTVTTAVKQADRVLITVRDSGPGIPIDHVELIFKSFYTTKPDGMGLGLPICKTIVEAHGGVLTAVPADPAGMIFTVDLPLRIRRQRPPINNNSTPGPPDASIAPRAAEPAVWALTSGKS